MYYTSKMKEKVLTGIENTNERIDRVKLLHSNLVKEAKVRKEIEKKLNTDHFSLNTDIPWVKEIKKDIQTINDICKKIGDCQFPHYDDDSCPMYSRHKTVLMVGLSILIPLFIKNNELHLRTTVGQLLTQILFTCQESEEVAEETTKDLIKFIDERCETSFVWEPMRSNGGTRGFYPI